MQTFKIDPQFLARLDHVVVLLRRDGFAAYAEANTLHTNAPRSHVLLTFGHGCAIVL